MSTDVTGSPATVYLISGASRGIGLALVSTILTKDEHSFVYAGSRNLSELALKGLQVTFPGRVIITRCVSADEDGNRAMAKEIEEKHGRIDVVIANAAISESYGTVLDTPLSTMEEHFRVNVLGPLALFQASSHLLQKSQMPRFITISSGVGSLQGTVVQHKHLGMLPYATSKAALNWMTRKIHFENEWIIAFPLTPGPSDVTLQYQRLVTEGISKDKTGLMKPLLDIAMDPAQAANLLFNVIISSTRETHGGRFLDRDGKEVDW